VKTLPTAQLTQSWELLPGTNNFLHCCTPRRSSVPATPCYLRSRFSSSLSPFLVICRYRRAWQDPAFRTAVARREQELRAGPWSDEAFTSTFDSAVSRIHDAAIRTLEKWGPVDACPREICQEWPSPQAEIDYAVGFIKNWTLARLSWFDQTLKPELSGSSSASPSVSLAGR